MSINLTNLAVCEECILLIANGELPPDTSEERDDELIKATAGLVYGNKILGYSIEPCQACGCKLHGERFRAVKSEPTLPMVNIIELAREVKDALYVEDRSQPVIPGPGPLDLEDRIKLANKLEVLIYHLERS